jgi:hypothetical protein
MAIRLGRALASVVVVAAMFVGVPTAGAVPLEPTPNELPDPSDPPGAGSGFQGGDGNQAPELGLDDWASLPPEQVESLPDPAPDSQFGGGAGDAPSTWYFDPNPPSGVSPGSSNILDSWSSVAEVDDNAFLYLAFHRAAGTGTAYLAFELNRDGQLWRNDQQARVPCRNDGDLLVTFQPQGNAVSLFVEAWRTSDAPDAEDPDTGCDRKGSVGSPATVVANRDVQGAVNAARAPIANSLPTSPPLGSIDQYQFGETALNLRAVLAGAVGRPCGAFNSVWMHSRSSRSISSALKDFVAPLATSVRTCSAAGTKWHDRNANGRRDPGDVGLAGWRVYADLNDNNEYDAPDPPRRGEPFAITDERGDYVIDEIDATGEYTLREEPTDAAPRGRWTCSYPSPCEHIVDPADEPFAEGRDFGNWRPARVTLTKKLDPPGDPGRFNLSVGRRTLPAAGHLDSRTFRVRPGRPHLVGETPADGTNAEDYESSVACGPVSERARRLRGATSETAELLSGQLVECTFVNVRRGTRSVTIDKVAPEFAEHGDTLGYELAVTNTGSVPFAAGDVSVRDRRCDAAPVRVEQLDETGAPDSTPEVLDPGDTWIYACDRATRPLEDPDDCQPTTVTNTGRVTVPGAGDRDRAETLLRCPPPRRPNVEIQKFGPETAPAGTALTYLLYVINTGEVPFDEADVDVSDPACDAAPELVARFDETSNPDTSPEQLDPRDVWVYRCTNTTPDPGADCQPSVVTNTSTVIATSRGSTVQDDDTLNTELTCPPAPPGPPAPPRPPEPPVPVLPPGVLPTEPPRLAPPAAGVAGRASLRPLRGCLRPGSRVIVRGRRIASISVRVRGRRVGGLRVRALQRRAIIRIVRNMRPGRHRATAVIRFQRGSATPTARLTRVVRICAPARPPRVTG